MSPNTVTLSETPLDEEFQRLISQLLDAGLAVYHYRNHLLPVSFKFNTVAVVRNGNVSEVEHDYGTGYRVSFCAEAFQLLDEHDTSTRLPITLTPSGHDQVKNMCEHGCCKRIHEADEVSSEDAPRAVLIATQNELIEKDGLRRANVGWAAYSSMDRYTQIVAD